MKDLFERCYNAEYTHTAEDGDYCVEPDGRTIYILFQWSNSHMDWVSNLNFPAKAYKRGDDKWRAHRGFLRVWRAMRDDIEQRVTALVNSFPFERVVCVGYSHGAALALLATEDMEYLLGDKVKVFGIGFGCPRVLWGQVPKNVKERLRNFYAVRNRPDIVTHVPPALFGFRHLNIIEIGDRHKYSPIDAHRPESYLQELTGTEGIMGWL